MNTAYIHKLRKLTGAAGLAGTLILLAACGEESDVQAPNSMLNLCSVGNSQLSSGNQPKYAQVLTRTYTDADIFHPGNDNETPNYLSYNKLYPVPINKEYTTIGAFLVQDTKAEYSSVAGYFQWRDVNSWNTTVGVRPGDFYIFGYMPSNMGNISATIRKRTGDGTTGSWADGCVMTIQSLSTVTPADVCVVVGVLKGADRSIPIDDSSIVSQLRQGKFDYKGESDNNFVYLLLDHLYTNVNLELSVEPRYAQLRTIVLKKVMMKSPIKSLVDVTVNITNDPLKPIPSGEAGIKFNDPTSSSPVNAVLFPEEGQYETAVSTDRANPTSIPGYFAPGLTTQSFDFEFIYDVYDKQGEDLSDPEHPVYGNLVRENCHAINTWSLSGTTVAPGKSFKVTATIRPTYLFQLSDPDLDNPTITLNTEPN